jgi:hypothetical protein
LAVTVGLLAVSCATQRNTTLLNDSKLPHTQRPTISSTTNKELDTATKAKLRIPYAQVPLFFEPNQGQTDERVHFLSRGRGYTLFLTATEAVLALHRHQKNPLSPETRERARVRGPDPERSNKPSCK